MSWACKHDSENHRGCETERPTALEPAAAGSPIMTRGYRKYLQETDNPVRAFPPVDIQADSSARREESVHF